MWFRKPVPTALPSSEVCLPGRQAPLSIEPDHAVHGRSMVGPFEPHLRSVTFALGCFWGAERVFWRQAGVWTTAVGYAGGHTPNPTYEEVCSGMTGHTEVVLVVYDPKVVSLDALLKVFWESHDPTQGMRQGNDIGTQYRSAIYVQDDADLQIAAESLQGYESALRGAGLKAITTELRSEVVFYYAETYHQQYLHKNPNGYCGIRGTGVACPIAPPDSTAP